ncbi:hypothetical protein, partial [Pseudomonas syringae group genomosp. 7]|uniref:hypothetical protein n=1 Tax=Pseudomonas syringae group genomosp. 7 TaxID=251699 RepID=UPI00376F52D3
QRLTARRTLKRRDAPMAFIRTSAHPAFLMKTKCLTLFVERSDDRSCAIPTSNHFVKKLND